VRQRSYRTYYGHNPGPMLVRRGWFGSWLRHVGRRRKPATSKAAWSGCALWVCTWSTSILRNGFLLAGYVARNPEVWNEDIGEEDDLPFGHLSSKTTSSNDSGLGSAS